MSEQTNQVPSVDPMEEVIQILNNLPTLKAMKDLQKNRLTEDIKKVIETMALYKIDLIRAIATLSRRESILQKILDQHYNLTELERYTDIDWATVEINFHVNKKD